MASVTPINDDQLIVAVQARPAIYDKGNKQHCNRDVIAKLWVDIGEELGFDAMTCKTRWTSMRDYFMRKYREKGRSGQAASSNKKWPFYDSMLFLVPYITPRATSGNLDPLNPEVSDDVDSWSQWSDDSTSVVGANAPEEPGPSSAVPQLNAQRKAEKRKSLAKESRIDNEIVRALQEPPMTDIEHFFISLVPMVSAFDDLTRMEFQRDVQDLVIRYARRQSKPAGHYFGNNYEQQNSVDRYYRPQ